MKNKKHNCYTCRFRSEVTGSAHSKCNVLEHTKGPAAGFSLGLISSIMKINPRDIKLNSHGVANGWAAWPINFDPVWVEECGYYEEQKPEE